MGASCSGVRPRCGRLFLLLLRSPARFERSESRLDDLFDQRGRQWLVRRELDRALALLPGLELGGERVVGARSVDRAMMFGRADVHERAAIDLEASETIADVLLGLRRGGFDLRAQRRKYAALLGRQRTKIFVDGGGGSHE